MTQQHAVDLSLLTVLHILIQDGNSKQTKMPYFESGWVDPEDLKKEEARKANKGGFKFPWN